MNNVYMNTNSYGSQYNSDDRLIGGFAFPILS